MDKVTCSAQCQKSHDHPLGPDHGEEGGEAADHQVHRGHRRPDEVIQVCDLDVMEKWGIFSSISSESGGYCCFEK